LYEGNLKADTSPNICDNPLSGTRCCGNGIVEPESGEECDDGEQCGLGGTPCTSSGGGCTCTTQDGDGCSETCTHEGSIYTGSTAVCGNGKIEKGEDCDDFNNKDGDGCSSICLHEGATCGDGVVVVSATTGVGEECDGGAGCAKNCLLLGNDDNGITAGQCGDETIDIASGEECDDGQAGLNYQETKVYIDHDNFASNTTYGSKIGSGVRDAFQNCFYPGAGPDCFDVASSKKTWDTGASSASWPNCQLP
jgi:cysteine-rich repeat protein